MMRQANVLGGIIALLGIAWPVVAAEPLHLDGKTPGLVAQRSRGLDLEDAVTLEAWIKPGKLDKIGARIIDKGAPGTNDGYLLDTFPGNSLRMIVAEGAVSYRADLPSDRWSHVAGVFSSTEGIYQLFLNGKQVASHGHAGMKKMTVTPFPLRVGADTGGGSRFQGHIARATVYGPIIGWRWFVNRLWPCSRRVDHPWTISEIKGTDCKCPQCDAARKAKTVTVGQRAYPVAGRQRRGRSR